MLETRKGGRPSRRPDKETLQHLSDMLTIEQIAQLYCVDRSTVCNWKKYYRLPPKIGTPNKASVSTQIKKSVQNMFLHGNWWAFRCFT
ncbi:MAG: helix-turn-helix domain-containing protein [Roseburia hominis]